MRIFGRLQAGMHAVREYRVTTTINAGERESISWNPPVDGGHLIIDFDATQYVGADISLDAGYTPEVGDVLYISMRRVGPVSWEVGDCRLINFDGLDQYTTFDGSDQPVVLTYSEDYSGGVWVVQSVSPTGRRSVIEQYHQVSHFNLPLAGADFLPSTGTVRQTMGMAIEGENGTELMAAFTINEGGGVALWRGPVGAAVLDLQPGASPSFVRAAFGNGAGGIMTIGDNGGTSTTTIGGRHASGGSLLTMSVPNAYLTITCPPVRRNNRVIVGTDAGVFYTDDFGVSWIRISALGPISAVALTDSYQLFTEGSTIYRSTTGAPTTLVGLGLGGVVTCMAADDYPTGSGIVLVRSDLEGMRFSQNDGDSFSNEALGAPSAFESLHIGPDYGSWVGINELADYLVLFLSGNMFGTKFHSVTGVHTGLPRTAGNGFSVGEQDGYRAQVSTPGGNDDALFISIPESLTHDLAEVQLEGSSLGATFRYFGKS